MHDTTLNRECAGLELDAGYKHWRQWSITTEEWERRFTRDDGVSMWAASGGYWWAVCQPEQEPENAGALVCPREQAIRAFRLLEVACTTN
jgi:hypothetical protein